MAGRPTLTPERKELLDSLVSSGATIGDMSKKHGFNLKTIRRHYPTYRTVDAARRDYFLDRIDKRAAKLALDMLEGGFPMKEATRASGLTRSQIKWLQPDAGLTPSEAGAHGADVARLNRLL